ncbi:MAG: MFS transporter [Candidatus Limnocylindrales bacterium]
MHGHPRLVICVLFFANGAGSASWASRLPEIRVRLDLGEGALGLALLGATVGLFLATALTSLLVVRFGSRALSILAGLAMSATLPIIGWAPSFLPLAAALVAYGMTNGALDLASNVQAVGVERRAGRSMLTGFHALFSGGALVGAGGAALAASWAVPVDVHLTAVAILLALAFAVVAPSLSNDRVEATKQAATPTRPSFSLLPRPLVGLGIMAFCVLLAEGAIFDWSAVYLSTVVGATPAIAAVGLAIFQGAMMMGRLSGDALAGRIGPAMLVRGGALLAAAGLTLSLVIPDVPIVLIGLAVMGLGIASAFPLLLSAAARTRGVASPTALGAITAAGYTGFLAGPPLIGFIAEPTDLRFGLAVVLACLLIAVFLAGRVAALRDHGSDDPSAVASPISGA